MKISKSILESIIRQIIREQEEDVEPSETDMRNAYASFLQAAEESLDQEHFQFQNLMLLLLKLSLVTELEILLRA